MGKLKKFVTLLACSYGLLIVDSKKWKYGKFSEF